MFSERRFRAIVGVAALIGVAIVGCVEPRAPSEDAVAGDGAASDASAESGDAAMTCELVGDGCEGDGCCSGPMTGTRMDLERNSSLPPQRVFGCSRRTPTGACIPHTLEPSCAQRVTEAGTEVYGTNAGFVTNVKMIDPAYEACPPEVERQVHAIDSTCDE